MRHVKLLTLGALLCPWSGLHTHAREITSVADETPIFITLGQSNADGYGIANAEEDARLKAWYDSESNPGLMKMWYRSTYLNTNLNSFCWAFEGTTTDVEPGWLNLWYRNENTAGRTAMNMHSLNGTWSNGASTSDAINRRGMEGQFGMRYQQAYPTKELYMIKLGCAGSAIDTWTHTDNHNWGIILHARTMGRPQHQLAQVYTRLWQPADHLHHDHRQRHRHHHLRRLE